MQTLKPGAQAARQAAIALLTAVLALFFAATITTADGYTLQQSQVITMICDACNRYDVADCSLPLAIARRETRFGANIYSTVDTYRGRATSVGVFQWYAGPRGDCVGGGAACSGLYYQQYGLQWRENLAMDIDRGVDLLTRHQRGLPDQRSHWYTPAGLNTANLPDCPTAVDLSDDISDSLARRLGDR